MLTQEKLERLLKIELAVEHAAKQKPDSKIVLDMQFLIQELKGYYSKERDAEITECKKS